VIAARFGSCGHFNGEGQRQPATLSCDVRFPAGLACESSGWTPARGCRKLH